MEVDVYQEPTGSDVTGILVAFILLTLVGVFALAVFWPMVARSMSAPQITVPDTINVKLNTENGSGQ